MLSEIINIYIIERRIERKIERRIERRIERKIERKIERRIERRIERINFLHTRAKAVAVAHIVEEMHPKMTGQALEDAGKRQRCPQMCTCAPECLSANGRAIDNGSSTAILKAPQRQRSTTIEQIVNRQYCGLLSFLHDADTATELCNQTRK